MEDIEKHIKNLKQYIKEDEIIENDNSDFAQFCKGHIEDIQAVLNELNRRIPPEVVKEKIKELEKYIYTEKNVPQDFLQYTVKIKISAYKDLLNKE